MTLQRNNSADNGPLVSRNKAHESFRHALRLFVGRGKRYSVKELSNGSGVPDRVIESAMAPVDSSEFRYPAEHIELSIAAFIGPEFTSARLSIISQGAYWLPEGGESLHDLARDSSEFTQEYMRAIDPEGEAGIDIGPAERSRLKLVASRMGPRAAGIAA